VLKEKYEVLILSSTVNSKLLAFYLSQKNSNIILVDVDKKKQSKYKDFNLYSYQEPFFSLKDKFYLNDFFSLIGAKKINNNLSKTTSLSIVFGDKKIYYHEDFIKDDIEAEFKEHSSLIFQFLDYIRTINEKITSLYFKKINYPPDSILEYYNFYKNSDTNLSKYYFESINLIYKKFRLPDHVVRFFNAILFILSGVRSEKYSCIPAIRLLSSALNGLNSYVGDELLENELNKNLKSYIDVIEDTNILELVRKKNIYTVRLNNFIGNIKTKFLVEDKLKNNFNLLNINTLNVFIENNYIPSHVGEYTLYLDCDKAYWYKLKDIYLVRIVKNKNYAVLIISSFNENNSIVSKETYKNMYKILKNIVPFIEKGKICIYPDFDLEDFEVNFLKYKIKERAIIFNQKVKDVYINKNNIYNCSRQVLANFGFEGSLISTLRISEEILRGLNENSNIL